MKQQKQTKQQKGYVSIETMLVAGIVVILAVVSMRIFSEEAMRVNTTISTAIEDAQNHYSPGP